MSFNNGLNDKTKAQIAMNEENFNCTLSTQVRGVRRFLDIKVSEGIVKATVFYRLQVLKFKISEGSDQN